MSNYRIMFVADLCGKPGRQAASYLIKMLKDEFNIDFVITNVENAAGGFGVTPEMSKKVFSYGADIQTSGNHIWDRHDIIKYIKEEPRLIRPANFPHGAPGNGYVVHEKDGVKVGVINLMGRTYMKDLDCPFKVGKAIVEEIQKETNIIFIDMHAEATSEKQAMMYYLDGCVTAIVGTHTHVQTADETVTARGTAYISDAGMTGAYESIIGMHIKPSLERFLTGMPIRFTPAENDVKMSGVIIECEADSGRAVSIERYKRDFDLEEIKKLKKELQNSEVEE